MDIIAEHAGILSSEFSFGKCGIAIPGLTDSENGIWVYAPFSGIRNFPISKMLFEKLSLPIFIDNDVNACAVGEKKFGLCKNTDDFIWITVSNGIGGSIFSGGALMKGHNGTAGEIGHIKVNENGRLCGCGAYGCLEAEAAGPAISAYFKSSTELSKSAKEIAELAKSGNDAALAVYEEAGYKIGIAVSASANILNPEKIVFGGGVSTDFELLLPGILRASEKYLFSAANPSLSYEKTALGYNAALLGAAALAL